MNFDRVFRKKEDIVTRTIGGEVFLVPIHDQMKDSQKLYVLNPIARYIWHHLDGRQRLADIKSQLMEEFEVEHEQLQKDIFHFIQDLEKEQLIIEAAGGEDDL